MLLLPLLPLLLSLHHRRDLLRPRRHPHPRRDPSTVSAAARRAHLSLLPVHGVRASLAEGEDLLLLLL